MYSAELYEALFDQEHTLPSAIQWGENGRMRTKTIKAGPVCDVEIFSVWKTRDQASIAKARLKESRPAQVALNERNARKRLVRKMNANFGEHDILVHPTLADADQPADEHEALKIIRWFMGRLKKLWNRRHSGGAGLKYIYIIEKTDNPERGARFHYHLIMTGEGIDREEVEAIWKQRFPGNICNTDRYQQNPAHLTGWAKYMNLDKPAQTKATRRRWNCSKNLVNPEETASWSDHKISRAKAQKIVRGFPEDARAVLEKAYPGYVLVSPDAVQVKTSEFVQGVYIYAQMRRRD